LHTSPPIFDSAFLSKLEQLSLLSRKLFRGDHHAERKSRQTGSSLEFADFRNYAAGDDLRAVDWNIYGRLDRLVVKLFEHEQDLQIDFLIDASPSMRWQAPQPRNAPAPPSKLDTACRIAASLSYIGLSNLDRVNLHWFGDNLGTDLGLSRGKSQFHKVLDFLRSPPPLEGTTRFMDTMRMFAQRLKRRGLVFILSDLLDPAGYQEALDLLRHSQFELDLIHVLDLAELRPNLRGDLRLIEVETQTALEVTAHDSLLRRYEQEVDRFLEEAAQFSIQRGIGYVRALNSVPFEDLVLRVLRDGRMIQ
jgi:uncharacterized protein (DUF58 family)